MRLQDMANLPNDIPTRLGVRRTRPGEQLVMADAGCSMADVAPRTWTKWQRDWIELLETVRLDVGHALAHPTYVDESLVPGRRMALKQAWQGAQARNVDKEQRMQLWSALRSAKGSPEDVPAMLLHIGIAAFTAVRPW